MNDFGYARIVEIFDKDETAGAFLRDDGEGGFSSGVYRMAREIERLRAVKAELLDILRLIDRGFRKDKIPDQTILRRDFEPTPLSEIVRAAIAKAAESDEQNTLPST